MKQSCHRACLALMKVSNLVRPAPGDRGRKLSRGRVGSGGSGSDTGGSAIRLAVGDFDSNFATMSLTGLLFGVNPPPEVRPNVLLVFPDAAVALSAIIGVAGRGVVGISSSRDRFFELEDEPTRVAVGSVDSTED